MAVSSAPISRHELATLVESLSLDMFNLLLHANQNLGVDGMQDGDWNAKITATSGHHHFLQLTYNGQGSEAINLIVRVPSNLAAYGVNMLDVPTAARSALGEAVRQGRDAAELTLPSRDHDLVFEPLSGRYEPALSKASEIATGVWARATSLELSTLRPAEPVDSFWADLIDPITGILNHGSPRSPRSYTNSVRSPASPFEGPDGLQKAPTDDGLSSDIGTNSSSSIVSRSSFATSRWGKLPSTFARPSTGLNPYWDPRALYSYKLPRGYNRESFQLPEDFRLSASSGSPVPSLKSLEGLLPPSGLLPRRASMGSEQPHTSRQDRPSNEDRLSAGAAQLQIGPSQPGTGNTALHPDHLVGLTLVRAELEGDEEGQGYAGHSSEMVSGIHGQGGEEGQASDPAWKGKVRDL